MSQPVTGLFARKSLRRKSAISSIAFITLFALFSLVGGCKNNVASAPATPPSNADHSITFTFNQTFANNPSCSSTVTTSCYTGFTEGYTVGTTATTLHTDATSVCTGTTQPETCTSTFNGTLPIGAITFWVEANYDDENGLAGVTTQSTFGYTVAADAPTNLNVTVD